MKNCRAPDALVDFHTGAASADKPVAEDKGFAIAPWTAVRFDNKKTLFLSDSATAMGEYYFCLLYTSPSPRDQRGSRMPSSA